MRGTRRSYRRRRRGLYLHDGHRHVGGAAALMEQLADSDSPGLDNLAVAVVAHREAQHSFVAGEVKLLGVGGSHQQGDDS